MAKAKLLYGQGCCIAKAVIRSCCMPKLLFEAAIPNCCMPKILYKAIVYQICYTEILENGYNLSVTNFFSWSYLFYDFETYELYNDS